MSPLLAAALFIAGPVAGAEASEANEGASPQRPHIVVVLVDDLGFSDLGPTGSEIATPSIDRLAAEGQLWLDFHNNAKCTTTRVSLLTGRTPDWPEPHIRDDTPTVAETLQAAGYRTVHVGKWHLAGRRDLIGAAAPYRPLDRGFDESYGLLDGCCNFFDPSRPDPDFKGGRVRNFFDGTTRVEQFPDDFYTTDAFTDRATAAIAATRNDPRPLFLHLCYTAPHYPLHAPADVIATYRGRYRGGWEQLRSDRFERQKSLGLFPASVEGGAPERDVPKWDSLSGAEQDYFDHVMATYAAMVQEMDAGVGRVLSALDEQGLADSTLVLFLSDNGGCAEKPGGLHLDQTPGTVNSYTAVGPGWAYAQNTPYRRFKSWTHEGGTHTPLLVRWPGQVPPGSRTRQFGHIIDLHATIAAAAGTTPLGQRHDVSARPVEGLDLSPAFRGETVHRDEPVCWYWAKNRAVRQNKWKAVWDRRNAEWELYDLDDDPTERRNRAADQPQMLEQLVAAWTEWAAQSGLKP